MELCEEGSYDAFARSLSNDANYIAQKLLQYNLPDIPGQTVLSHKQTADMWHETNHTDPTGYFASWGYDMDQFNALISMYYNNLKTSGTVFGNRNAITNASPRNVIRVNNPNSAGVQLVSFNDTRSVATPITNRMLGNNTNWLTDETNKDVNGVSYHRVATNEWVQDSYITK